MEMYNYKMVPMQVASHFCLVGLLLTFCSPKTTFTNEQDGSFEIYKHQSKDGSSIISGQCFDFESKVTIPPASISINGVVLESKEGIYSYNVLEGNYKVRAGFVGKKWLTVNLNINKGDSIHVKLFLIDDDSPLYEKK